jgi:hypothetical protein
MALLSNDLSATQLSDHKKKVMPVEFLYVELPNAILFRGLLS